MSDRVNLQRSFKSLESGEIFESFSKVIINVSEDVRYIAGTDTGRTLEFTSPYGSQKAADDILARVRGFQYQPFKASGAILDPAAELGDGISADGLYSAILSKKVSFGALYDADVSAPGGEKINYKFPYKSKQDRTIERNYKDLSSKLTVQSGLISAEVNARKSDVEAINAILKVQEGEVAAKVSKTGGNNSSFGWSLLDSSWTVSANNKTVFKITASGAEVMGKITATSGKIGGFDITSNYLSYNNMVWGGTNTNGVYLGPNGIQLGKNFKVDNAGNLHAASGTFTGNVNAGNIQYGGSSGYFSGSGIESRSIGGGQIGYNTITTGNTSWGINTSLGYGDYAHDVFNNQASAPHISGNVISGNTIIAEKKMQVGNFPLVSTTMSFVDGTGKTQYIHYWTWKEKDA